MFFDDQRSHLKSPAGDIPMVHIPFGIANKQQNSHLAQTDETITKVSINGVNQRDQSH